MCSDNLKPTQPRLTMATFFRSSALLVLALCLTGQLMGQSPANDIEIVRSGNKIEFFPKCHSEVLGKDTLDRYHFFWDFGNGDYSFEPTPVREYYADAKPIKNVSLTISNIKDDEIEERAILGGPACNNNKCANVKLTTNIEAPPSRIWNCSVNANLSPTYTGTGYDTVPKFTYQLEQSCEPKKGHSIMYAVRIINHADSINQDTGVFEIKFTLPVGLQVDNSASFTHLPSTATLNQYSPAAGSHNSNGTVFLEHLTVLPGEEKVGIINLRVSDRIRNGSQLDVPIEITSGELNAQGEFDPIGGQVFNGNYQNKVVYAWDPNFIVSYPNHRVEPGEKMLYHVRFQNDGKGAAKGSLLELDLPDHLDSYDIIALRYDDEYLLHPDYTPPSNLTYEDFRINEDSSLIVKFIPPELDSGRSVELFILAKVKDDTTLCGDTLKATMGVKFDNEPWVNPSPHYTQIVCPNKSNEG